MELEEKGGIAPLSNVSMLAGVVERLGRRRAGVPGIAAFYGPSGFGKSSACAFCALKYDAIYLEVKEYWTRRAFLGELLRVLGVPAAKTIPEMVDQVVEVMLKSARPLLLDEADFLVKKNMIEVVRGIYESTGSSVVIVGEQNLPQLLKQWERVHSRVLEWAPAKAVEMGDVEILAGLYSPEVQIEKALLERVHKVSGGSARRVVINVDKIRNEAELKGLGEIGLDEWGGGEFYTGLPVARRVA